MLTLVFPLSPSLLHEQGAPGPHVGGKLGGLGGRWEGAGPKRKMRHTGPQVAQDGANKMKQDRSRRVRMNAAGGSWGEVVEKKRCLQRLFGDLECKVGWIFSGNGGRRDFVDFRRVLG